MFGTPFKQRAHYVFNYHPRYYSERKERLDNLKGKHTDSSQTSADKDYQPSLIRKGVKTEWTKSKKKPTDTASSKRLAIIIAVLVGACAYILELHTLI